MSRRRPFIAVVAASVLVLSACGSSSTDTDTPAAETPVADSSPDTSKDASTEATETEPAPEAAGAVPLLDFEGTTLEGASFSGATLAGKPTVLWFWAPWCPTCRAQAPAVSALAQEYADTVNVVGVGGAASVTDIEDVARDIAGPTHLIDEPGSVWQHFGITAQSTYVVLDADSNLVTDGEFLSDDDLRSTVASLAG